jgi:hypothetical protein
LLPSFSVASVAQIEMTLGIYALALQSMQQDAARKAGGPAAWL